MVNVLTLILAIIMAIGAGQTSGTVRDALWAASTFTVFFLSLGLLGWRCQTVGTVLGLNKLLSPQLATLPTKGRRAAIVSFGKPVNGITMVIKRHTASGEWKHIYRSERLDNVQKPGIEIAWRSEGEDRIYFGVDGSDAKQLPATGMERYQVTLTPRWWFLCLGHLKYTITVSQPDGFAIS